MVMISDFYGIYLSRDLKVPGSSPGVGFSLLLADCLSMSSLLLHLNGVGHRPV